MICHKCHRKVYRAFSYFDSQHKWHSQWCENCAAGEVAPSLSATDKLKSRVLMPDGKVLTGIAGIRERDRRLRLQKT